MKTIRISPILGIHLTQVTPRYCDVQQLDATIRCVYLSQTDTYLAHFRLFFARFAAIIGLI